MILKSSIKAIAIAISYPLLTTLPSQAITVTGTFTDANAWQNALNSNGQNFSIASRSLAGLDCSPYTNGGNYSTLSNFCNTGINSQLRVNNILSDPNAALSPTSITSHGIEGSGYSVSYGNTGKKSIAVLWTLPKEVQGVFLDFTSSAFTKDTQIAVTGADGTTQVVAVPNGTPRWGFAADAAIRTIEFIATQNGDENFSVAKLSLAGTGVTPTTQVPSPLLLPGLVGLGVVIVRKRQRQVSDSASQHSA